MAKKGKLDTIMSNSAKREVNPEALQAESVFRLLKQCKKEKTRSLPENELIARLADVDKRWSASRQVKAIRDAEHLVSKLEELEAIEVVDGKAKITL